MKLTPNHVRFWREQKHPEPAWFARLEGRTRGPDRISIHALIPDKRRSRGLDTFNTLSLLRRARVQGGEFALIEMLQSMAHPLGWCSTHAKRRHANAKKWLRRMNAERRLRFGAEFRALRAQVPQSAADIIG